MSATPDRTLLFVPGDRPDRFVSAATSGADLVIVDLEDAVAADAKDRARDAVADWLGQGNRVAVRVGAPSSADHEVDLRVVGRLAAWIVVPKAEDPRDLDRIRATYPNARLLALVESARGIRNADALASSADRLALGNADLAADLGVAHDDETALLLARSTLVVASAAAGRPAPVDGVTVRITDDAATRRDSEHAVRLGFGGRLCLHPRQVPIVREAFRPTADELAWAREIIDGAVDGVSKVGDLMVDAPLIARARAILASHDGA